MNSENLYKAILRNSFSAFTKKVFYTVSPNSKYLHNWHIDLISEYLVACQQRKIKRLIINIPPRYLKSISVNVAFPAWLLGHNPKERIISSSYAQGLSVKHSIDSRLVIQSEWYKALFPNVNLVDDQNTKTKFVTSNRGYRLATATGSAVTGEGGNFLLIDDPLNSLNSNSDVARAEVITWFEQAFSSRLDDKKNGVIILVMQRLHEDDLAGHLIEKGGWEHLNIPAENITGNDIVYNFPISGKTKVYKPNEVLHEEREDEAALKLLATEMGSYAYAGQYLQQPAPVGGGIIKTNWFNYFDNIEGGHIYQSWDTANKDGEENDYSACVTWCVKDNQFYVLDVWKDKLQFPELVSALKRHYETWKPRQVLIEDKASGQQLLQTLRKETRLPIVAYNPKQMSKSERMHTASIDVEAGRVYLKNKAHWLDELLHELKVFPNGRYKDTGDAFSMFINWYKSQKKTMNIASF